MSIIQVLNARTRRDAALAAQREAHNVASRHATCDRIRKANPQLAREIAALSRHNVRNGI